MGGYTEEGLEESNFPRASANLGSKVSCRSFTHALFYSQMNPGSRESCILLENGSTQSLVVRASQRSLPAVRKFRTVREEECYARGCDQCVQTLLLGVVAPETYRNDCSYSLCELKL